MYLAHERRTYILRLLEERGNIRATTVARELGVTDETVRNDLIALEKKGLLRRVHGGAVYQMPSTTSPADRADDGHASLGACWADRLLAAIGLHTTLYIEYSPHAMALVARLAQTPCTVIANHPRLLSALQPASVAPVCVSTGGYYDKEAGIYAGPEALATVRSLAPDLLVLAPDAFSPETGCGYRSVARAKMAAALAFAIRRVLVLCPTSRWRAPAAHTTGPLTVQRVYGEDDMPDSDRRLLLEQGVMLELAPAASPFEDAARY